QWRWREAYEALSAIDTDGGLAAEQLDQLAIAAYLLGRDADAAAAWTRAHHCFTDAAEKRRAARCGFWLSLTALLRGDGAVGAGWLARAERVLEDSADDCVERVLLLALRAVMTMFAGDAESARAAFDRAATLAAEALGGDADVQTLVLLGRGQAAIALGDTARAVTCFDEAMVAV